MRTRSLLLSLGVAVCCTLTASMNAASRDEAWKRVEAAMAQGLPRTALQELEPIVKQALADRAWAEAAKAITRKITLEASLQGNKPEAKILGLEAQMAKGPKELEPVFEAILGNWYWQFFQQNRWRFLRRTAIKVPSGQDLLTWDLPRLYAATDQHFTRALAAERQLKAAPIAAFNELLEKGTVPDAYRPTLYDFLAHEALAFYTAGEQAAAKPQDAFEVSADSPMLGEAQPFLAWKPTATDTNSPAFKAIRLFQDLLRWHQDDADLSAFLDLDILRLVYGKNIAFGEGKEARFKAAMKTLAGRHGDHPLASLALYHWASTLRIEEDLQQAREVAVRGRNAHPDSPGGRLCANLIAVIEAKSARLETEQVWEASAPIVRVHYRNVSNVWFRAYTRPRKAAMDETPLEAELRDRQKLRDFLAQPPALAWSNALPPTADYREKKVDLPVPAGLKPGFYAIVASHDAAFSEGANQLSVAGVWVSRLALVLRSRYEGLEGFVLEALSGEPVAGARIEAWHQDDQGKSRATPPSSTDTDGFFRLPQSSERLYWVRASKGQDQVAASEGCYASKYDRAASYKQTIFFTDRALYRPGQTVQYKGICLLVDADKDDYRMLPGERVTVAFRDANNKSIATQDHRCNDYGSFSGSFVAPRSGLLGQMRLTISKGPSGAASFSVEEYKRPKFEVALEAPKTAARLRDQVSVSGRATSYTGAAIDGAQVNYRVTREVRMPWWWGWYGFRRGGRPGPAQEIAHGAARTGADGTFKIEFTAHPDPKTPEKDEPTFVYRVHADVTDTAGETRSGDRELKVGYTALEAKLEAAEWQTDELPIELSITTTSLDGEPQVAEGVLKVYSLKAPEKVHRAPLWVTDEVSVEGEEQDPTEPVSDLSNPNQWPLDKVVAEQGITTDQQGKASWKGRLPLGFYRAVFTSQDRYGKAVTGRLPLQVLHPPADHLGLRVPSVLAMPKQTVEPGDEFLALWGTGYEAGRAFIEIEHRHRLRARYWTKPGQTQALIRQAVDEAMRGGFTVHITQVRENRAYLRSQRIDVPWSNRELTLKWEHFTSKMRPGQQETWTAVITGPKAEKAVAEMVAALYDASLDVFRRHAWARGLEGFRHDYSDLNAQFANRPEPFGAFYQSWGLKWNQVDLTYRSFPAEVRAHQPGYPFLEPGGAPLAYGGAPLMRLANRGAMMEMSVRSLGAPCALAPPMLDAIATHALAAPPPSARASAKAATPIPEAASESPPVGAVDLTQVAPRRNLNETAFFFPQLVSDTNGVVRMSFIMPEALTQWRFLGFAHDRECRSGFLEDRTVTARDLMVQPNPPRFLREGDVLEFTVKVSNQSDTRQQGKVRLTLNNALNEQPADGLLGNRQPELPFDLPARESRSYSWRLTVPDGLNLLAYKAVAASAKVSDGEEGLFPVLARRIYVTESLPLSVRGPATKKFEFKRLAAGAKSSTLAHQGLTVQMVSQPAWYAVMALPYLMEFPYECTEQTFNRFYANALARFIANSNPKVRRVFDAWKATPALDSPLEKNQELKSVVLEETPWLRDAQDEARARKNVGILFDDNRLTYEQEATLRKLLQAQLPDGAWPWFPGGQADDYITLYITTGFGRLRHLGADVNVAPALRALARLDTWLVDLHADILKQKTQQADHLSSTIALYLYGRSFFLKDRPLAAKAKEAVDYFLGQARQYWLELGARQSQGHLALALLRLGDPETARGIVKSLKERSVTDEELGRFWRDTELSWSWSRAPIETQAVMIEALAEVVQDAPAVEECNVWLLKQKQTQDWKTTKATADAVYALLLRGRDLLASDSLVEVSLGGKDVRPANVEAGTGFYEKRFSGAEVKPALSQITVQKTDPGVSWGSVHWQYLEDMAKVKPYEGTPLRLKKALFTKKNTPTGPVLEAVGAPIGVGEELVVRLELRVDRDLEYVHLKDQRGSGTEPVNVLSGYRSQDGLWYYESTRDAASHFFISYLPKGTYVFEYSVRVAHRGTYQTGLAQIQCLYAPEFNSHSESLRLEVR